MIDVATGPLPQNWKQTIQTSIRSSYCKGIAYEHSSRVETYVW